MNGSKQGRSKVKPIAYIELASVLYGVLIQCCNGIKVFVQKLDLFQMMLDEGCDCDFSLAEIVVHLRDGPVPATLKCHVVWQAHDLVYCSGFDSQYNNTNNNAQLEPVSRASHSHFLVVAGCPRPS